MTDSLIIYMTTANIMSTNKQCWISTFSFSFPHLLQLTRYLLLYVFLTMPLLALKILEPLDSVSEGIEGSKFSFRHSFLSPFVPYRQRPNLRSLVLSALTMTPTKTKRPLPSSTSVMPPQQPRTFDQWKTALRRVKSLFYTSQYKQCLSLCAKLLVEAKTPVGEMADRSVLA